MEGRIGEDGGGRNTLSSCLTQLQANCMKIRPHKHYHQERTETHARRHTRRHTHTHTQTHARRHTHTHARRHTHSHADTHARLAHTSRRAV